MRINDDRACNQQTTGHSAACNNNSSSSNNNNNNNAQKANTNKQRPNNPNNQPTNQPNTRYKIPYVHLHMTDDHAWVFPSDAFPLLGSQNVGFRGQLPLVFKKQDLIDLVACVLTSLSLCASVSLYVSPPAKGCCR